MKREIKFRGKRLDNGEWLYGYYFVNRGKHFIVTDGIAPAGNTFRDYEVDPETIGEYTGSKDKHDKEFYEGDIVKAPLLDPILFDVLADAFCEAEIKLNKGAFVVSYYKQNLNIYLIDLQDKIEIIGNIYDNPELLEQ